MDKTLYTVCPECDAQWTIEEIDEQHCFSCGYPDYDENEEEAEWDIDINYR